MILTLTEVNEACSFVDITLTLFMTSRMSQRIFARLTTSGKIHSCSRFSPFGDNGPFQERLRNSFQTDSLIERYISTISFDHQQHWQ